LIVLRKERDRARTMTLASLPPSHPLYPLIRKSASCHVKKHRSPLHNLFFTTKINPNKVEKVQPTCRRPNYIPLFSTHIANTKQEALEAAIEYHRSPISVYSDGSGFKNGIGAAAVLYINKIERKTLKYHLGPPTKHTVYKAELVGCYDFDRFSLYRRDQ